MVKMLSLKSLLIGVLLACLLVSALVWYSLGPSPILAGSSRPVVVEGTRYGLDDEVGQFLVLRVTAVDRGQAFLYQHGLWYPTLQAADHSSGPDSRLETNDALQAGAEAWVAASRFLGAEVQTQGYIQVENVVAGDLAEQVGLREGDRIMSIDGNPVDSEYRAWMFSVDVGRPTVLSVARGGSVSDVTIDPGTRPADNRAGVDVGLFVITREAPLDPYPKVLIPPAEDGSSSGLVDALAFLDAQTTGSLRLGQKIAVTGRIDTNGGVGSVSGVAAKIDAAVRAGSHLVLVPADNIYEAQRAAGDRITVISVSSLEEAVLALCERGASSAVCPR